MGREKEHDIDVLLFWGIFSNFDILGNHDGSVRNVGQRHKWTLGETPKGGAHPNNQLK